MSSIPWHVDVQIQQESVLIAVVVGKVLATVVEHQQSTVLFLKHGAVAKAHRKNGWCNKKFNMFNLKLFSNFKLNCC